VDHSCPLEWSAAAHFISDLRLTTEEPRSDVRVRMRAGTCYRVRQLGGITPQPRPNAGLPGEFRALDHATVTSCGSCGRIVAIARNSPGSKGPLSITSPNPR